MPIFPRPHRSLSDISQSFWPQGHYVSLSCHLESYWPLDSISFFHSLHSIFKALIDILHSSSAASVYILHHVLYSRFVTPWHFARLAETQQFQNLYMS